MTDELQIDDYVKFFNYGEVLIGKIKSVYSNGTLEIWSTQTIHMRNILDVLEKIETEEASFYKLKGLAP
jgi:hypothetical protein